MKQQNRNKRGVLLTLSDAVVSVTLLIMSLRLINVFSNMGNEFSIESYNYSSNLSTAASLFFVMAVSEIIRYLIERGGSRLNDIRHLVCIPLYLISGTLTLVRSGDFVSCMFGSCCYGVSLILSRLDSILCKRNRRNVVLNIIAILLLILALFTVFGIVLLPVFLILLSLGHIAGVAFSQINFRALQKIIRKTYAVEVIFGMLLLMVAFAILLQDMEPGIETFADGLWYCFAIVTTIGFGDVTVNGIVGRLLSVILGIYGIIVVALVTSIIVNFYNEVKNEPEEADAPADRNALDPQSGETEGANRNEP